jgi:hypothetical protein
MPVVSPHMHFFATPLQYTQHGMVSRDTLQAYASAGFYAENKDLHVLEEEVGGYAERGFGCVKIKVGMTLHARRLTW